MAYDNVNTSSSNFYWSCIFTRGTLTHEHLPTSWQTENQYFAGLLLLVIKMMRTQGYIYSKVNFILIINNFVKLFIFAVLFGHNNFIIIVPDTQKFILRLVTSDLFCIIKQFCTTHTYLHINIFKSTENMFWEFWKNVCILAMVEQSSNLILRF